MSLELTSLRFTGSGMCIKFGLCSRLQLGLWQELESSSDGLSMGVRGAEYVSSRLIKQNTLASSTFPHFGSILNQLTQINQAISKRVSKLE